MSVPAAIVALTPMIKDLIKAINDYVSRVRVGPDKTGVKEKVDYLQELSKNLVDLVKSNHESSQKLNHYVSLMRHSITAGANCTELARVLETLSDAKAKERLNSFIDNVMKRNLRQLGIQGIKDYTKDYSDAKDLYYSAEKFAGRAKEEIESNRKNSCVNMDNANDALDKLAMLATDRVDGIVEELQNAYKVLEKPLR